MNRFSWLVCLTIACVGFAVLPSPVALGQDTLHPQELRPVRNGRSKALRELPPAPAHLGPPRQGEPVRLNPHIKVSLAPLVPDPLLANQTKGSAVISSAHHIEGMGTGLPNFQIQLAPPDANGAIGETQFVQWVNNSIAVFNKTTGNPEGPGPILGKDLWKNFGGNCEERNDGDPVVQYDKLAKRWVLAQFGVTNGNQTGFSECVAISTSADALGDYWLYEYQYPSFDDYPKLGVWPDGYYASFDMYNVYTGPDGNAALQFLGARACVYDRERLLAGLPGTQQCFQLSTNYFGLLPSDLDGIMTPPNGTPSYFIALGTKPDTLDLWRFKVDWKDPRKSTFGNLSDNSPNAAIPVAHYNLACNGSGGTCIPQPKRVEGQEQLDSLGDRLMFRAAYRQFANHGSLVVTHSVDTGGNDFRTAMRWYELRDLDKVAPLVFQQGTFSPDTRHRWMGSIAMDRNGNIALGYNVSGDTEVYPGIRVTGRLARDPKGAMGDELALVAGSGIQTCTPALNVCLCRKEDGSAGCNTLTRWGDYSAITLDPLDDCTFWYTAEYQGTDGAYNWRTGIASFTLDKTCIAKDSSSVQLEHKQQSQK